MEFNELTNFVATVGFPVTACYFVWRYLIGQFTTLIDKVTTALDRNTQAMLAIVPIIQHCKDSNGWGDLKND